MPKGVLDEHMVKDLSGEADVADVRELVLRGMGITSFNMESLAKHPWGQLEALSLSQNMLGEADIWGWLAHCDNLRSLNLNFCELTSLDGIQSLGELEQLYLSGNQITNLAPLRSCAKLVALSLYRNKVSKLDTCVDTLRELPRLTELDLSGNPVWFEHDCKARCILGVPVRRQPHCAAVTSAVISQCVCAQRLRKYDDEALTDLDREMALDSIKGGIPDKPTRPARPSTISPSFGRRRTANDCRSVAEDRHLRCRRSGGTTFVGRGDVHPAEKDK